jgi:hypothetical protein
MRRSLSIIAFLSATFALLAAEDFKAEPGFTPLFNGTDLGGWKVAPTNQKDKSGEGLEGKKETPTKRFTFADGVLTIDPKVKGDITLFTQKTYDKDAHIKFEFKPGKGSNNDIYFRGTKFDLKTPDVKNMKEGEWNAFEIIVTGDTAEFKNNGESIKKVKTKPGATPLGIRAEAGPTEYRHWQIKN